MAAPESQRQPGGMGIGYSFQPSQYHPQTVNVPTEAGALWAQVGDTALKASAMLQNSALNPRVRAEMKEAITRSNLGIKAMQYAAAHPKWMRATVGESPSGATQAAPIGYPVAQQVAQGIDWNEDDNQQQQQQQQQQKQQPTITRTGANTGVDQSGNQYHEAAPGSNKWIAGVPPPSPPSNLNAGMAQGGLVRGYAPGGPVTDKSDGSSENADHEALLRRMTEEREAVLGAPQGMFLNPATGSYEPLQQGPPPAPQQQGASIWSRPTPIAPPPAPQAQAQTNQPSNMLLRGSQPPSQTAGAIQQVTQAPGVALADWQAQNAHPVMASGDALKWAQNFDTGAQRAQYLPHGGPNAEPAYAFHMKGGGVNTVPISQIVKNGGGPFVAGQNTSAVLSASDALSQQPPPGQGQSDQLPSGQAPAAPPAPSMTLGATAQPPGGVASFGQPPAAPSAYNAAAYQMPQGPTITQTGEVNPALMAGGTDAQAAAAAKWAAKSGTGTEVPVETSSDEVAKMNADAASNNPNLDWKKDEKGKKYIGNQDPQHPFWEQRFYPLTGGFQTGPWTAENIRKQQLLEEFGGPAGVPAVDQKTGKKIVLDKDTIDGLSPEEQEGWLAYAKDYKNHTKYPLPGSDEGKNLANNANAVAAAQRIKDKLLYMKENNIPMSAISQDEFIRSAEAGWAKSAPFPWQGFAMGGPPNKFADELRSDFKLLNAYLARVQGGHYPDAATPKPEDWGTPAIGDWIPAMGIPRGTSVSTIPALASISAGDDYDQAIRHIQEVLDNATTDYKNAAKGLPKGEYRLPDVDQKNLYDLDNKGKGYIDDPTNLIWDKNHQKMVNGYGDVPYLTAGGWKTAGGGGQAKPSPTPVSQEVYDAAPRPRTKADYDAIKQGKLFVDKDGKLKPKP